MSNDLFNAVKNAMVAHSAGADLSKLKKATEGFEAIFLKKLFSQMRSGIKESQFGQSYGKEIYEDMFDEAMANSAAKSKTLGMGDMLLREFSPRLMDQARQAVEAKLRAKPDPQISQPTSTVKAIDQS